MMHTPEERPVPKRHDEHANCVQVTRGGVRWQLVSSFAPRLDAVLASEPQVIKQSQAKRVTLHSSESGSFYVKRYHHDAFAFRPLKFFFKSAQARQEWRLAAELERRGVPVVRHLALGERWTVRGLLESVLITESFDGVPANETTNPDPELLVRFVRKLAQARVSHTDMHPANLLVNEARGEIRLVDLDGVTLAETLSAEALEREMLAQLCITMALPVTEEVRQLGMEKRKRALAARSKRCLKANRDFDCQRHGALKWHVRLDALSPELTRALSSPDEFLAGSRMLKNGRSSTVGARGGMVVKRFNFRRWLRPLKDLFRESRSRQAFRKAYHLELCGVSTARPLAAADEKCCGLVVRGFVVMMEIPGAQDAIRWNGDRRKAARASAQLLARMHHEGFSHRDLKETNILFDQGGKPYLIDLEGLNFESEVTNETTRANLARFARGIGDAGLLTRELAMTFLLHYCRNRRIRPRQLYPERK